MGGLFDDWYTTRDEPAQSFIGVLEAKDADLVAAGKQNKMFTTFILLLKSSMQQEGQVVAAIIKDQKSAAKRLIENLENSTLPALRSKLSVLSDIDLPTDVKSHVRAYVNSAADFLKQTKKFVNLRTVKIVSPGAPENRFEAFKSLLAEATEQIVALTSALNTGAFDTARTIRKKLIEFYRPKIEAGLRESFWKDEKSMEKTKNDAERFLEAVTSYIVPLNV